MSAYPGEHLGVSGGGGGKFAVGEELAAGDDCWTVRRGGGHGLFLTRGRSELLTGEGWTGQDEAEGASRVLQVTTRRRCQVGGGGTRWSAASTGPGQDTTVVGRETGGSHDADQHRPSSLGNWRARTVDAAPFRCSVNGSGVPSGGRVGWWASPAARSGAHRPRWSRSSGCSAPGCARSPRSIRGGGGAKPTPSPETMDSSPTVNAPTGSGGTKD